MADITPVSFALGESSAEKQANTGAKRSESLGFGTTTPRISHLLPLSVAIALVVPLLLLALFHIYRPEAEKNTLTSLELTASLKAQQVESWLAERRGDANILAADTTLLNYAEDMQRRGKSKLREAVIKRFEYARNAYGYPAVYLLNQQGETLLALGSDHQLSAQTRALAANLTTDIIHHTDFYVDSGDKLASLNFVAPLQRESAGKRSSFGALVLHTEPTSSIFPLILAWPTASLTGETLLVRREGDAVVFLNQLRHHDNSTLKLRYPLSTPSLVAGAAVRSGKAGTMRGEYYRGTDVLAAYKPIDGTDWYLVAKVDYAEAMAPMWHLLLWIGALTGSGMVVTIGMLRLLWTQHERLRRLADRARQAQAMSESEARYRAVTDTARDAIVTADASGDIVNWNPAATRIFGFTPQEILGSPLTRIIPERFQERAMRGFERLLNGDPENKDGSVAELLGRRSDDSELLLERSLSLWRTATGQFFTCTMRDIGERRKAEDDLRIAAAAFESHEGMVVTNANGVILRANHAFTLITGYASEEAVGSRMNFLRSGKHDDAFYAAMWIRIHTEGTWQGEIWNRNRNGEIHPHWLTISAVSGANGKVTHYVGTYTDITQQIDAQKALAASETWFRSIFENANTGIAVLDSAACLNSMNEAFCGMLGYRSEELHGLGLDAFTHPADYAAERLMLDEMIAIQRDHYRLEKRYLNCDRRIIWADVAVAAILGDQGQVTHFVVINQDITERKHQEEQTRALLAQNETILANALVGIVYLQRGQIITCNRRFEELFQYQRGELLGQTTECLYGSHERFVEVDEIVHRILAEGNRYGTELLLRRKDGSQFWAAINGCAIDSSRPNEGSIWIYADVSERRRAEAESGKLLQAVEQSPTSIVITNREGVIEYVNPSFCRVTGYARAEAVGRNPSILASGDTPRTVYEDLWRTILAGGIWRGVLRNRCKNGTLIWEETSISPIVGASGEIAHFVAVKEDVTERLRIAQELQQYQAHLEELVAQRTTELTAALEAAKLADRSKDEFLANITHELRTPLSAVLGFSGLAQNLCTEATQRDYLDKVSRAGKTLLGTINDLLDLSKITAGRMDFDDKPFHLGSLVESSLSVVSLKAEEKGLELSASLGETLPEVLVGDSLRLQQILLNLLSNAVKFTARGGVELSIGLREHDETRSCLEIKVTDTGIGLRESEIAQLFKPFSQADASMTRKFGGTGLGLAICKRLAELMGGGIRVSSRPGHGTIFTVWLWLETGTAEQLAPSPEIPPEPMRISYTDACVLVVDDQPFNREIVCKLLSRVGIAAHVAGNGREALDLLDRCPEPFDLVFMDIQMPVMDGYTATRNIRRLERYRGLPVIAMTAHTMAHERELGQSAGISDHIGKPFDESNFYSILAKWMPDGKQQMLTGLTVASGPASNMPSLPGVDTRAGLALLQGDIARYQHWLRDFCHEAPNAVQAISRALTTGETELAGSTVHTLKGRTGLLGMRQLHSLASTLEAAIDNGDATDDLVRDLDQGIAAVCTGITASIDTPPDVRAAEHLSGDAPPSGTIPDSVAALLARLNMGDSDADLLLEGCIEELMDTPWEASLRRAATHVRNFDYIAAAALLSAEQQLPSEKTPWKA